MENQIYHVVIPSIALILLAVLIKVLVRLKKAKVKIAKYEIVRMLQNGSRFIVICEEYKKIPLKEIGLEWCSDISDYLNSVIRSYSTLSDFFGDIKGSCLDTKRRLLIINMISYCFRDYVSLEKLAEIVVDCYLENINGSKTRETELSITNIIDPKKINLFRDEVIKKLQLLIETTDSEDGKILLKARLIKLKENNFLSDR